jgi:hypothetical protein
MLSLFSNVYSISYPSCLLICLLPSEIRGFKWRCIEYCKNNLFHTSNGVLFTCMDMISVGDNQATTGEY